MYDLSILSLLKAISYVYALETISRSIALTKIKIKIKKNKSTWTKYDKEIRTFINGIEINLSSDINKIKKKNIVFSL